MFRLLIYYLLVNASVCEFDGLNKFRRKKTSMGNYVHPSNLISSSSSSKTSAGLEYNGFESSLINDDQVSNEVPISYSVPLIVRRLVNVLLRKAVFKDSDGETVLLESLSDNDSEKMSMSLRFSVSTTELITLREFGLDKLNLSIHEVDELLNNLFSERLPSNYDCEGYSWDGLLSSFTDKLSELLILEVGTFLCFIWILMRLIRGKSSWSLILFAFISSALVWEKARLLEEETIKSHSEQLRLANIPGHCHGIDDRSWWEKLIKVKPEDKECYEHHYHRLSKPNLRVSYYKAFLNLFGPFLDMIISSVRLLFKSYDDNWVISNWIFQSVMIPTFFLFLAFIFTIYFGGSIRFPFLSFGGVSSHSSTESNVRCLVDQPKPPPRLKNGRKKKEIDEPDVSASSPRTIVLNIKGGNVNLKVSKPLPFIEKKELLPCSKKEESEFQRSSILPKDQVDNSKDINVYEDSDIETENLDLEANTEDEKESVCTVEDACFACGDSNIMDKEESVNCSTKKP